MEWTPIFLAYTKSVTLFNRSNAYKADPVTVEKVLSHSKMTSLLNTAPTKVLGEKFVTGIEYKNSTTGEEGKLDVTGIFVEIGAIPTTSFVEGLLELTKYGQIITSPINQKTSVEGVWAAGDCTDGLYHQNNIAAGDAVKALEDIYLHLRAK